MSTFVVSDIHGCFAQFEELLQAAGFDDADELYVLGDVIDRGPAVGACVEWLVDHRANGEGSNVHFLMGNHEEMASWVFRGAWSRFKLDPVNLPTWQVNGGDETIKQLKELDPATVDEFQRIAEHAPKAALVEVAFEGGEGARVLLCHAGIRPAEPESEPAEWLIQSEEDLLWIGAEWYAAEEEAPLDVVSGHVPTRALQARYDLPGCPPEVVERGADWRMMHWGCRHDIDCGCVYGGRLALLRLEDWAEFYAPA